MPAIVKHPEIQTDDVITNLPFFPDINVQEMANYCQIDKRMDADVFKEIILTNLIRVNDDLKAWKKQKQCLAFDSLATVKQEGDDEYGDKTKYQISYDQAVKYGIKADVLRHFLNYDLTKIGESEAEEKEDQATWYAGQSTHAVRRIVGKNTVRVKRIKPKQQTSDTGVFYGIDDNCFLP